MGAATTPVSARQVVSRTIAGETLLVPVGARTTALDRIFLLNRVGAYLWPLLDGTRTRDQLCALVRERFAVPAGHDLDADVDQFLDGLAARELIQR